MLIVLSAMMTFPISANAEQNGTDREILLDCRMDGMTLTGMNWRIYLVGRQQENGEFAFSKSFAECGVNITKDMNADQTRKAADSLVDFANENALSADAVSSVGTDGKTHFDELEAGYYLLVGEPFDIRLGRVIPMASLVNFDGTFKSIVPKLQTLDIPGTMSEPPGGLNDSFPVTDRPHGDSDTDSETDGSTSSFSSSVSRSDSSRSDSYTNEGAPQTGQLWWPVPLLSVGGFVFIAMGVRINNRRKEDGNNDKESCE